VYTSNGGSWLTISNLGADCCVTPEVLTVSVNGAGLPAGTYTGEIVLSQYSGRTMTMTVPVTLTVIGCGPFFDTLPGEMSFSFAPSTANPASQTVQVRAALSGALNWTLSAATSDGGNWLTMSANHGTAPSTVTIGVRTSALPGGGLIAGVATGQLVFQTSTGRVTIPVSVTIGTNAPVQASPLVFNMTLGGPNPSSQSVQVNSTGTNFNVSSFAASEASSPWLSISPAGADCCVTPKTLTASVNATTLPAGIYTGELYLVQYSSRTQVMTVPVILTITDPRTPATIAATGGTPQSTTVDTAFASPLSATVKDAFGNAVPNVTVTFNAPGSGASGTFAGGVNTAMTNAQGIATSAGFTANSTAGSYTVTATVGTFTTNPGFSLTNLPGPPP